METNGRINADNVRILMEAGPSAGSGTGDLAARTGLSSKQIKGWFDRDKSKKKRQEGKEKKDNQLKDLECQNTEYHAENQRLKDVYAKNEIKIQEIRQLLQQRQTCCLCSAKASSINNSYIFTIPPGSEDLQDLENSYF